MKHHTPDSTKLEFIPDSDIRSDSEDWFGHRDLAQVALRIILSVDPPFNIGVFGGWGTGKTSLINLIHSGLEGRRLPCVTLDAWKYSSDVMRRAFLIKVASELAPEKLDELEKRLYRDVQETTPPELSVDIHNFRDRAQEWLKWILLRGIVPFLVISVVLLLLLYIAYSIWFYLQNGPGANLIFDLLRPLVLYKELLLVPLLIAAAAMIGDIARVQVMRISRSRVDSLEVFERMFSEVVGTVESDRLVIFVDNLDRLRDDKMIEALETIKTFLNHPKCIYVVACDDAVVRSVVSRSHRVPGVERPDGDDEREEVGEEYLDKFFQFSIRIPPYPEGDILDFAERQFAQTRLYNELQQANVDLGRLLTVLLPTGTTSPRNVKKLLNEYMVYYRAAEQREQSGDRGVRRGMLTDHPVFLAKMTVLRTEFPEFYNDLSRNARLFDYVDHVLDGNADSLELHQRELCAKYFVKQDDTIDWLNPAPRYRTLIDYLRKTRRITVQDTLPFLSLSQDLTRRELADEHLAQLRDNLANANVVGVREMFRVAEDEEYVRYLVQYMRRTVGRLRGIEQSNGLQVLCNLVDEVPSELRPTVAEDVAGLLINQQQLDDFKPDEVFAVLEHAQLHPTTNRLVGRFVGDLENPSDSRSQEILRAAFSHHELVKRTARVSEVQNWIRGWLDKPQANQVSHELGEFLTEEFSKWYDDEDVLFDFFTGPYFGYVIGRLAGRYEDIPETLPKDRIGQRLTNAFQRLSTLDLQRDPTHFWPLIDELLQAENPDIFDLALGEIERHLDGLESEYVERLSLALLAQIPSIQSVEEGVERVDRAFGLLLQLHKQDQQRFTDEAISKLVDTLTTQVRESQPALAEVGRRRLTEFTQVLGSELLHQPLDAAIARIGDFPNNVGQAMQYLDVLLAVDDQLSDEWRRKVLAPIHDWVQRRDQNQLQTARRLLERMVGYKSYHSILPVRINNWTQLLDQSASPPQLEGLVDVLTACEEVIDSEQAVRVVEALTAIFRANPGQAALHPHILSGLERFAPRLSANQATETINILLSHYNNLSRELRWQAAGILSELHPHMPDDKRRQYADFIYQQFRQRPEESLTYIRQVWPEWDGTKRVESTTVLYHDDNLSDPGNAKRRRLFIPLVVSPDEDDHLSVIFESVLGMADSRPALSLFLDDLIPSLERTELMELRSRFLTMLREKGADQRAQAAMEFLVRTAEQATDHAEVLRCLIGLYERGEPEVTLAATNTAAVLKGFKLTITEKDDLAEAMASALKRMTDDPARKVVESAKKLGFLKSRSKQGRYFKDLDIVEELRAS